MWIIRKVEIHKCHHLDRSYGTACTKSYWFINPLCPEFISPNDFIWVQLSSIIPF